MLSRLYQTLRERGSRCRRCEGKGHTEALPRCPSCKGTGGKGLGDRSVMMVHTLLSMALSDAVEAGDLPISPVERIPRRQRPRYRQSKQPDRTWSDIEARRFLDSQRDTRLYSLWALALDTGARRGELAALRWSDVDLEAGAVRIERNRVHVGREVREGSTKSDKPRTVDLDPRTVAALRSWQKAQKLERLAAGPAWAGGDLDRAYLFTDELGEVYRPDTLSERFERAQDGMGVPRLVFHGLRHTSATLALLAGVQVHVVSKRLGHANVSITLDTYSHVLPQQDTEAARSTAPKRVREARV